MSETVERGIRVNKVDVVVPRQDEIRVFANGEGGVSIWQTFGDGDEVGIFIDPRHVPALCKALRAAAATATGNG